MVSEPSFVRAILVVSGTAVVIEEWNMKKFLVAIMTVLWGSSVQAQSKEELLPICIEESQEIIKFAQAFRSGVSSIGETMRPSAFASMVLAPEEKELLKELLLKSITAEANPKNIELELSSGFARLETKKDLISDMLEEAFEENLEFEQMSLFIAGCTNAFGDEVYNLQEKVDELSEENETVERKLKATEKALEIAKAGSNKSRSQLNIALETQRKTEEKLQKSETTLSNFLTANEQQVALIKDAEKLLTGITSNQSVDAFRKQIAAALAAKKQAEQKLKSETTLLNQKVTDMGTRLRELSGLLYLAEQRDQEAQVQLQSLGSDLNTALARAVAEERRRRVLEEQERKRLEGETKSLAKYRSEFFGRLRDLLGTQEGVRIDGDRFVFSSEVLFPPGGAQLSPLGEVEITKIATILRGIADEIPPEIDWVIRVDGHTDNVPLSGLGEFEDNWELSQARALSVVKYMANVLAIPPSRLAANGFGQYQPINTADTPAARAQNRRIELKFTEK
jgi:chemotaxis protein MotB